MDANATIHRNKILDQFSKQAVPFALMPAHMNSVEFLIQALRLSSRDKVLDVACGPGLLACEFARVAGQVTGIDLTPAMIDEARRRQATMNLTNLNWHLGEAVSLPFDDRSFDVVTTRYSFHHFTDPAAVLDQMIRVCRRPGKILIVDVALEEGNQPAYDRMERRRDPSHTHALTYREWDELFSRVLAAAPRQAFNYGVDVDVENLLASSFPEQGGAEAFRRMVLEDVGINALGIQAKESDGNLRFTFPIAAFLINLA